MAQKTLYRNHAYFLNSGQALLELMVFGAIVIMLLGLLINYGLRYNYQQQAMQRVFRKAMQNSSSAPIPNMPKSVSNVLLKDIHIPEPANPFGQGSVMPVSGAAAVTRDYMSYTTPENIAELPILEIEINGTIHSFKTAGVRTDTVFEDEVSPVDPESKYYLVYGATNVETIYSGCLEYEPDLGEDPERADSLECLKWGKSFTIIDDCDGEIIDYSTAARRCRLITSEDACRQECDKNLYSSPTEKDSCKQSCEADIPEPWYCAKLEQIFQLAGNAGEPKNLGVEEDYEQVTETDNILHKTEGAGGISTTDTINWHVDTTRRIAYRRLGDMSGNTSSQEVISSVEQERISAW